MNPPDDNLRLEKLWLGVLLVIPLAFVLLPAAVPPARAAPADQQVLGWYAAELRAGNGLVFNPGQPVLLIASPAYMLLLAAVQSIAGDTSPVSILVFVAALALGANSLFRIARRTGLSYGAASLVAGLFALAWPLWLGVGTALPLMTALCLIGFDLALADRWTLAGLVFAAAALTSPEALLLALPILLLAVNKRAIWRFGLALLVPLALAVIGLRLYYGPALWEGLLILKSGSSSSFETQLYLIFTIPTFILAIWAWYRQRASPIVAVCGAWIGLYLAVFIGILGLSAASQLSPLAGPVLLLAIVGTRNIKVRPIVSYVFVSLPSMLLVFLLFPPIGSRDFFPPESPPQLPDAVSVGTPSAGLALDLRQSPDQVMISFDGQFQPDVKTMIERGDVQSALIRYAPDCLVIRGVSRVTAKGLASGAWARLDYRPIDEWGLFRRYSTIGSFVAQPANAVYGTDIRLVGLALDQSTLQPGQLLRVRLDWEFARPASRPVTIDLWLESGEYVLAAATDSYEASVFEAGRWSTYHTLTLEPEAWPGPVTLRVGVIVSNGVIARLPVATLDVTAR